MSGFLGSMKIIFLAVGCFLSSNINFQPQQFQNVRVSQFAYVAALFFLKLRVREGGGTCLRKSGNELSSPGGERKKRFF